MILTVTLNAALDVTYHVPRLRPGASHRVEPTGARAGGKGVNVARVLHALGHDTVVTGLAGGASGQAIRADLAAAGLRDELVEVPAPARRTVTIVSTQDGEATAFNEPGPPLSISDWTEFVGTYHALARRASVVVLSGSLPPGVPPDAYAQLIGATTTPTILDASAEPLLAGLPAGPDVIKPNAEELAAATGDTDPRSAAHRLRARGAGAVVASLGAAGLFAVTGAGTWRAAVPETLRGNPTGAGDACVAALAIGLAGGSDWPEVLGSAVAVSAAAVACPLAGDIDLDTYRRLRPAVLVEETDAHADR